MFTEENPSDQMISVQKILEEVECDSGTWYDFDDSRVKKIPVNAISKQYSGSSESACKFYK